MNKFVKRVCYWNNKDDQFYWLCFHNNFDHILKIQTIIDKVEVYQLKRKYIKNGPIITAIQVSNEILETKSYLEEMSFEQRLMYIKSLMVVDKFKL